MNTDVPLFSVVVIARNERETLPRLLGSLTEFLDRGGDVVVVDTGSTDGTQEFARAVKGVKLLEMTCTKQLGHQEADLLNEQFIETGESRAFKAGDRYFDFSMARNFAAEQSGCDVVAMPDCDEVYTILDIDKINEAITRGVHQFEYNFVFAHDSEGKPMVQFRHCKFYDRRKLKWTGVIHEVLTTTGPWSPTREYVDYIKLEHWQNPSTARGQYLTGLGVDCRDNPGNDRNAHYFARELMYSGRPRSAIAAFKRHIAMDKWPAERAQSMIFIGDCLESSNALVEERLAWYSRAFTVDPHRREALIKLAEFHYKAGNPQPTACYAQAALQIPLNDYYGNRMEHYSWYPHEMLYWAYWNLGKKHDSQIHWNMARKYAPLHSKFLHDARFYMVLPKVSIVIPHVAGTREESLAKLQQLIKDNANYPNYEVVVELDDMIAPQGCPKTFNRGVDRATGDYVMFLGDDCEPQPDFLIHAVLSNQQFCWENRKVWALTALNDGLWDGKLATHWMAPKGFLRKLPTGAFLHEGYHHVGCDNELTAWAKKDLSYNYCPEAKIKHTPVDDEVHQHAWDENQVARDRALLLQRCEQYELDKTDAMCSGAPHELIKCGCMGD